MRSRWAGLGADDELDRLAVEVAAGRLDPYSAADRLTRAVP
ncbi:MAG: hypothetical protein R2734_16905 [Nocardioides sp.]